MANTGKFSREEINSIKNLGRSLSLRPIYNYLKCIVEEYELADGDRENLLKYLSSVQVPEQTATKEYEFPQEEKVDFKLVFQLGIVDKEHKIDIMAPKHHIPELLRELDLFANLANVQYKQLVGSIREFYELLCEKIPWDFSNLRINQANRTMAFDENFGKRLGVVARYIDKNGNVIVFEDEPAK